MSVVIWHNPRCSKSRATLKLLQENGIVPEVRLYLENPPSKTEIENALAALGVPAAGLMRKGEPEFKEAGLGPQSSDVELIDAMARFPKLIERPLVLNGSAARIGRPPESVLDIVGKG